MRSLPSIRRLAVLVALTGAIAGALPASATTCPLLTDPAGDATTTNATLMPAAPEADVLSADIASGATTVTAVLRVASLAHPEGGSWVVSWHFADTSGPWGGLYAFQASRQADGSYDTGGFGGGAYSVAVDEANGTITWTAPRSNYPELAPGSVEFLGLHAQAGKQFGQTVAGRWIGVSAISSQDDGVTTQTYVDGTAGCIPAA
jgi:hypothetical protein